MINETVFLGGCPVIRPEGIYLDGHRVISLDPSLSEIGVGDIGCSGIDLDEWKNKNRVKLYPGQRIRWILARSTDDKSSLDTIRAQAEGAFSTASVFQKWFDPVALLPGDYTETEAGKIDNLKVLGTGTREEMIAAGQAASLVIAQRAEDMPGPISVRLPKIYVLVEFIYRGTQSSMPWPMFNDSVFARKWCPTGALWGLSITFGQGKDATVVPKETSLSNPSTYTPLPSSEVIAKAADDLSKKAADAAGDVLSKALPWIVGTVVVVGGVLIVRYLPRPAPSPPPRFAPSPY
jgi:hypothetical protein